MKLIKYFSMLILVSSLINAKVEETRVSEDASTCNEGCKGEGKRWAGGDNPKPTCRSGSTLLGLVKWKKCYCDCF